MSFKLRIKGLIATNPFFIPLVLSHQEFLENSLFLFFIGKLRLQRPPLARVKRKLLWEGLHVACREDFIMIKLYTSGLYSFALQFLTDQKWLKSTRFHLFSSDMLLINDFLVLHRSFPLIHSLSELSFFEF